MKEMEWISVKDRMPEMDSSDEPQDCEMLTDYENEVVDGYFDDEWWIKQRDPFVGHISINTHPTYDRITHWRYKI